MQEDLDRREKQREDPRLVRHGTVRFRRDGNTLQMRLGFLVSNPGDVLAVVEDVQIISAEIANPMATAVAWTAKSPALQSQGGFPAVVFPGGLTELDAVFEMRSAGECDLAVGLDRFQFTVGYRIGASQSRKAEQWFYERPR